MYEFLNLPNELIHEILSFLDGADLLNLRRVCQKIKYFVNSKEGNWVGFKKYLREQEDILKYLECPLKIPNIYIHQYPDFDDTEFLELCAPYVKKLEIENFFACQTEEEWDFLRGFSNLKELKILEVRIDESNPKNRIPDNFKNLKVLSLMTWYNESERLEMRYFKELIKFCSQTDNLAFPNFNHDMPQGVYQFMMEIMDSLERQTLKQGNRIKWIDMIWAGRRTFPHLYPTFFKFVQYSKDLGIKIKNLNPDVIDEFNQMEPPIKKDLFDQTIVSLDVFVLEPNWLFYFGWYHLETLIIISSDFDINRLDKPIILPALPNLKSLSIYFDTETWKLEDCSKLVCCLVTFLPEDGAALRKTVTELNLDFNIYSRRDGSKRERFIRSNLVQAGRILRNVPNLKKLRIKNWFTLQWEEIFIGLAKLTSVEELIVNNCETFTDKELIGNDPENPLILKLTGRKICKLLNLKSSPEELKGLKSLFPSYIIIIEL